MVERQIPRHSSAVLDTSVIFAMGGPSNEKYRAFERFVRTRDLTVLIPSHVAEELGESPDGYSYQRDRLRAARSAGWLSSCEIDFAIPGVSEVVDTTRERMCVLSAEDVTEDEIERTDTILAGVAYQRCVRSDTHVSVFVSDAVAERAIEDSLRAANVGERTTVVEGRTFLTDLVG